MRDLIFCHKCVCDDRLMYRGSNFQPLHQSWCWNLDLKLKLKKKQFWYVGVESSVDPWLHWCARFQQCIAELLQQDRFSTGTILCEISMFFVGWCFAISSIRIIRSIHKNNNWQTAVAVITCCCSKWEQAVRIFCGDFARFGSVSPGWTRREAARLFHRLRFEQQNIRKMCRHSGNLNQLITLPVFH